jgi:hypothetical protein
MRDPRDCYGGECAGCGGWFRDEDDLNDAMFCECCERDAEAEEEAERADLLPDDWFGIATDITGAGR